MHFGPQTSCQCDKAQEAFGARAEKNGEMEIKMSLPMSETSEGSSAHATRKGFKSFHTYIARSAAALSFTVLAACVAPAESDIPNQQAMETDENIDKASEDLLIYNGTTLWTQNNNVIPMCWHEVLQFPNADAANAAKAFVQRTIATAG